MRALLIATGLAILWEIPTAIAGPQQLADPNTVVQEISVNDFAALLTQIGATDVKADSAKGIIEFTSGDAPHLVGLCRKASCPSMVLLTPFKGEYPIEYLNRFNQNQDGATALRLEEGIYAFKRAVTLAGGVTRRNLAINIAAFANDTPEFAKYLNAQLVASKDGTQERKGKPPTVEQVGLTPADIEKVVAEIITEQQSEYLLH